jgi:hypothetical protein
MGYTKKQAEEVRRGMRKGERREERLQSECHPKTMIEEEEALIEIERNKSIQDSR